MSQTRVPAEAWNEDFGEVQSQILDYCAEDEFVFFFIDPCGWKLISADRLQTVLSRPHSEFLINFMYDFVSRAVPQVALAANIEGLLGVDGSTFAGLHGDQREQAILRAYRDQLSGVSHFTQ